LESKDLVTSNNDDDLLQLLSNTDIDSLNPEKGDS
jgi:hypothetical protein